MQCNNQVIGFDLLKVLVHQCKIDLFSLLISIQLIRHLTNIRVKNLCLCWHYGCLIVLVGSPYTYVNISLLM